MERTVISKLMEFIDKSPSVFHVIENIKKELLGKGFCELSEQEEWKIEAGKGYFVTRNMSSIIGFKTPEKPYIGFNIVASHSDSPTFKIKENPEIAINNSYISLNTEKYGGMLMSTWLDRPLSVAGRVVVKKGAEYKTKLVNLDRDLLMIPSLAIHMDRTVNDGKKFNPQKDMLPLFGDETSKDSFNKMVADSAGEKLEDIVATDLYLYNRQKSCVYGANNEYIGAPRLDDLQCAYASLEGFIKAAPKSTVAVLAVFDNEEVGSTTKQGAASTFLADTLARINVGLGKDGGYYTRALASSFMVSADNAHAVHPNNTELADPTNKPYINKGVVIKYNANQKYTTDAVSAAIFKGIAKGVQMECQSFANRSDLQGGSTLGNISGTQVAINTVDVGLPQLAMHSSFETAGVKDTEGFAKLCESLYNLCIKSQGDGAYIVE